MRYSMVGDGWMDRQRNLSNRALLLPFGYAVNLYLLKHVFDYKYLYQAPISPACL